LGTDAQITFYIIVGSVIILAIGIALLVVRQVKVKLLQKTVPLSSRLQKTHEKLIGRIESLLKGKTALDDKALEDIEEILFTADLGVPTTQKLLEGLRDSFSRKELKDSDAVKSFLKEQVLNIFSSTQLSTEKSTTPYVVLVVGVNGVGKTTTIAKLAKRYTDAGKSVLIAAGDTFRAAAVEQIKEWGRRINVPVIAHEDGGDPAAVMYDSLESAKAKNIDIVIGDTAGRLHTKVNLMEELKKIDRVMKKVIPDAPHEILLVLDATTGQNAFQQVKLFNEALPLTGLVMTKLDGTAKGGVLIGVVDQYKIPVKFIGVGEQMGDLLPFDAESFTEAIFS